MSKEDWISVGVKLFGIYLIVLAIIELPIAIANTWQYSAIMHNCNLEVGPSSTKEAIEWHKTLCQTLKTQSIRSSLALTLYIIFGFYFIRSGKLVKNILCKENT